MRKNLRDLILPTYFQFLNLKFLSYYLELKIQVSDEEKINSFSSRKLYTHKILLVKITLLISKII